MDLRKTKKNENIAIIVPHKGLGDIIFHHSFIKSIYLHHKKKIILFANRSTKANLIYSKSEFIEKVILIDLKRPNKFLYIFKILYLIVELKKFNFKILYYTGKSKWHLISIKVLSLINTFQMHTNYEKKRFIIDYLDNFLRRKKIKNCKNFKLNLSLNLNNKFKKEIKKYKKPWVFLSIDTSENQIEIENNFLLRIISNLKKKYKTIFVNTSLKNSNKTNFLNNKIIKKTHNFDISEINHIIKNSKLFVGNESGPAILSIIHNIKSLIFINNNIIHESKKMPSTKRRVYFSLKETENNLKII